VQESGEESAEDAETLQAAWAEQSNDESHNVTRFGRLVGLNRHKSELSKPTASHDGTMTQDVLTYLETLYTTTLFAVSVAVMDLVEGCWSSLGRSIRKF
jgi:hypothetical protein